MPTYACVVCLRVGVLDCQRPYMHICVRACMLTMLTKPFNWGQVLARYTSHISAKGQTLASPRVYKMQRYARALHKPLSTCTETILLRITEMQERRSWKSKFWRTNLLCKIDREMSWYPSSKAGAAVLYTYLQRAFSPTTRVCLAASGSQGVLTARMHDARQTVPGPRCTWWWSGTNAGSCGADAAILPASQSKHVFATTWWVFHVSSGWTLELLELLFSGFSSLCDSSLSLFLFLSLSSV